MKITGDTRQAEGHQGGNALFCEMRATGVPGEAWAPAGAPRFGASTGCLFDTSDAPGPGSHQDCAPSADCPGATGLACTAWLRFRRETSQARPEPNDPHTISAIRGSKTTWIRA